MLEGTEVRARERTRALCLTVALAAASTLAAWAAARVLVVKTEGGGADATVVRADAMAVLAGSSTYRERTRLAARLFGEGRALLVLLTDDGQRGGWSTEEERNLFFVERAESELKSRGVPAEKIEVVPATVSNTYDEAVRLRRYAERKSLRSLLVVTSAYQVRRARWTFEKVFGGSGVNLTFEAVPPGDQTPRPLTWWLHAQGWRMVAGEYIKMVYYFARFG